MLMTQTNSWEPGYRKRTIKKEIKIGPLSLKFISIALIAVGALFYLAQSTQGAAQKYQIMQLSSQASQLEAQGKDLEVEAVRLKSLNEIKNSSGSLGLVADSSN
ncbi:TPA: hypothetical protein DD449_02415 [Candidatus Berkelbacteria bacterium]|uniref:Cell division protein FtsL n=1 Tax=Berkelbacteria bacterium GW2011_GWE1_39_12 TaxID=1618337 RepID=A0A0G4B3E3_9BACT|nr:MAG: hypothetical protein UT28_C0001G0123 [Berkelbacteria bacterium GW2011_GWE1_39_12]HBO60510.1 hypothetical protein [Candidatus Berkelbacteria bacterium]